MLKIERSGRRKKETPKRRFLDVVTEDVQLVSVSVTEKYAEDRVRWKRGVSLWRPLKGKFRRKKKIT